MTSPKPASILEPPVSHPKIVEFAQRHQGKDLNIAGYKRDRRRGRCYYDLGMLVSTEMGK